MKIESVIRRKAGSSQTIGGITYHWNDKNGHVCEVEDPEHAKILLSHPEGWRAVGADIKPKEGQGSEESKPEPKATRKTAAKTNKEGQGGE